MASSNPSDYRKRRENKNESQRVCGHSRSIVSCVCMGTEGNGGQDRVSRGECSDPSLQRFSSPVSTGLGESETTYLPEMVRRRQAWYFHSLRLVLRTRLG